MAFLTTAYGLTDALSDITSAVGSVVTMATTGKLAIFFWSGVVMLAIGIMSQLKH